MSDCKSVADNVEIFVDYDQAPDEIQLKCTGTVSSVTSTLVKARTVTVVFDLDDVELYFDHRGVVCLCHFYSEDYLQGTSLPCVYILPGCDCPRPPYVVDTVKQRLYVPWSGCNSCGTSRAVACVDYKSKSVPLGDCCGTKCGSERMCDHRGNRPVDVVNRVLDMSRAPSDDNDDSDSACCYAVFELVRK